MATEYKLSYTASEINTKLGQIDTLANKKSAFYVNFDSSTMTADKTNAEIYAAYNDGYVVYVVDAMAGISLPIVTCAESYAEFSGIVGQGNQLVAIAIVNNVGSVINGDVGGGEGALCVNVIENESGELSANYTASDIYEAWVGGRSVYAIYNGRIYYPDSIQPIEENYYFAVFSTTEGSMGSSLWFEGNTVSIDDDAQNIYAKIADVYTKEEVDTKIAENAGTDITVDSALSPTSTNPVSNSAITAQFTEIGGAIDAIDAEITGLKKEVTTSAAGLMSAGDKSKLDYTNIAYGTCSTDAATAAKEVVLSGNSQWTLTNGAIIMVKFDNSNTASSVTLNVNGTGAYPLWYNNAEYTSNGTAYTGYAGRTTMYMFNGTHYIWISNSYDSNTTYTNVKLGHGYATCSTEHKTAAKVATLSGYTLVTGGIVSVKFTYAVPGASTLNINSKGAKSIYYRGAKITNSIINAGDIATFMYNGSYYILLAVDRWQEDIESLQSSLLTEDDVNALIDTKLNAIGIAEEGAY